MKKGDALCGRVVSDVLILINGLSFAAYTMSNIYAVANRSRVSNRLYSRVSFSMALQVYDRSSVIRCTSQKTACVILPSFKYMSPRYTLRGS